MAMQRRRFVAAMGSALAAPRLFAQAAKIHRIGFLGTAFASGYVKEVEWVRAGLRELGYVEGRNLAVEYRWAEGKPDRVTDIARELVVLNLDAIVVHGMPGALAAAKATSTIPIVMADGADPVAAGIAKSLARPGGNVTGSTSFVAEEAGKRLQLIKEVAPGIKRIAFLYSSQHSAGVIALNRKALDAAAAAANVALQEYVVREASDLPDVVDAMGRARIDAVVINSEPLLNSHAGAIAGMMALKRIPAIGYASFADAGGLLAYGANRAAVYGRVGYFLDRIFKGAKPADIPIEQAAKFDLVVNLKTARGLGLKVPQTLLLRADRVIE